MSIPAPTPAEKALARVLKISGFDAWSLVIVAVLSVLLTLALGNLSGTAIGLLVLAGGVIEFRGRRRLRRRDPDGMRLLVRSQMLVLAVILVYCATRLGSFDGGYLKDQVVPELRQNLLLFGVNLDESLRAMELSVDEIVPLVRTVFFIVYGTVMVVSLIYQGGLAMYYRRKTDLVTEALAAPPVAS